MDFSQSEKFLQILDALENTDPLDWTDREAHCVMKILKGLHGFVDRVFDVDLDLSDIEDRITDPKGYRGFLD